MHWVEGTLIKLELLLDLLFGQPLGVRPRGIVHQSIFQKGAKDECHAYLKMIDRLGGYVFIVIPTTKRECRLPAHFLHLKKRLFMYVSFLAKKGIVFHSLLTHFAYVHIVVFLSTKGQQHSVDDTFVSDIMLWLACSGLSSAMAFTLHCRGA